MKIRPSSSNAFGIRFTGYDMVWDIRTDMFPWRYMIQAELGALDAPDTLPGGSMIEYLEGTYGMLPSVAKRN